MNLQQGMLLHQALQRQSPWPVGAPVAAALSGSYNGSSTDDSSGDSRQKLGARA